MSRSSVILAALAVAAPACVAEPGELGSEPEVQLDTAAQALGGITITRDHIVDDVYHYGFVIPVGDTPNAAIAVHRVVRERAPWVPRRTARAVMMLHGDFADFASNFAPVLGASPSDATGIATWLAQHDIDVWGTDRRWAGAPADADLSDFDAMGLDQELDDLGVALAFARGIRLVTAGSTAKLTLIGFSRGGELAYFYASREAAQPASTRHVGGLVPLDVYVSLAPEDEDLRLFFCDLAAYEYDQLAQGFTDVPNDFQQLVGQLALDAPDDPSPFAPRTNRVFALVLAGRTFLFFPASPFYHLAGITLDAAGVPAATRFSPEPVIDHWFASAPPHQSMRESADTDALTCGDAPLPLDLPLSRIRVPLFLLAAAGGYGEHAVYSTTQVGSTDVTTLVIRRLPVEDERFDFGHGDLLYATDAPALAWQPLLDWLTHH